MIKHRRLIAVICFASVGMFLGWLTIDTLRYDCAGLDQAGCRLLWGLATASVVGGILLTETWIASKKARGEWRVPSQERQNESTSLSGSQVWSRSVARIVLSSLIAGLPLLIKGAFMVTAGGVMTGFLLDLLVRGIMNWLPPIEERG